MRIISSYHSILNEVFIENCSRKPSLAVPGLALSMDKIVAKTASGGIALTPDQQRRLYEVPDKTYEEFSEDVNQMTLAERQRVKLQLQARLEDLKKKMKSDDEERKRLAEAEKELKLRKKLLEELRQKPLEVSEE